MLLQTELCLTIVLVAVVTAMGCDDPSAGGNDFDEPRAAEAPPKGRASLEYEDAEDFAILNDRSNLRRSDVSPLDHRRSLSRRLRDELLQDMGGVELPTDEEIALVSMRWFVTGTGIVVQNPTMRPFTVSAYFSAMAEPACGVTVPMRAVSASGSAMLSPQDTSDCEIDRADVTLTDQYGFLVDQIAVKREEREP